MFQWCFILSGTAILQYFPTVYCYHVQFMDFQDFIDFHTIYTAFTGDLEKHNNIIQFHNNDIIIMKLQFQYNNTIIIPLA